MCNVFDNVDTTVKDCDFPHVVYIARTSLFFRNNVDTNNAGRNHHNSSLDEVYKWCVRESDAQVLYDGYVYKYWYDLVWID